MDPNDCSRLLAYEDWANREVLDALRALPEPPAKAVGLLAHIAAARTLWLDRLDGRADSVAVWPDWDLDRIADRLDSLKGGWSHYLRARDAEGLLAPVAYTNQRGEAYSSRPLDIFIHMAMHGPYHRGQIAMALGAAGHMPPATDFIVAVRGDLLP